jgi:hypothetical protein
MKEPQAGEWWRDDQGRIAFIAFDERTIGSESSLPIVAYYESASNGDWFQVKRFVEHLPDCDSWHWQITPQESPKRVPVRLYWYDGNIVGRYAHIQPTDKSFHELLFDGNGFYVEVQP